LAAVTSKYILMRKRAFWSCGNLALAGLIHSLLKSVNR